MDLYNYRNPAVSIILPTFNREKLLKRAINSVLAQSFNDWELLILDDGSNDNTAELCSYFVKSDKRIKYFFHENIGLPLTLNKGIDLAKGFFITFLGSDDKYLPNHLELRVNYLKESPETDMLHGGVKIKSNEYIKDKNNLSKMIHLSKCVIGGTFFGKTSIFKNLNGFKNIPYSEDSEFFERAIKKYRIEKVEFPTYIYYRDSEDSISNNI